MTSDTPRTDAAILTEPYQTMTELADRLAEALEACQEDSQELLAEHSWWLNEPRCGYAGRYLEHKKRIAEAKKPLPPTKSTRNKHHDTRTYNASPIAEWDGSPPFADRQKVDARRYDATNPKWNHMGICIVIGRRRARCESGWMVNIMAKDGTSMELDSHWLSVENDQTVQPRERK